MPFILSVFQLLYILNCFMRTVMMYTVLHLINYYSLINHLILVFYLAFFFRFRNKSVFWRVSWRISKQNKCDPILLLLHHRHLLINTVTIMASIGVAVVTVENVKMITTAPVNLNTKRPLLLPPPPLLLLLPPHRHTLPGQTNHSWMLLL